MRAQMRIESGRWRRAKGEVAVAGADTSKGGQANVVLQMAFCYMESAELLLVRGWILRVLGKVKNKRQQRTNCWPYIMRALIVMPDFSAFESFVSL